MKAVSPVPRSLFLVSHDARTRRREFSLAATRTVRCTCRVPISANAEQYSRHLARASRRPSAKPFTERSTADEESVCGRHNRPQVIDTRHDAAAAAENKKVPRPESTAEFRPWHYSTRTEIVAMYPTACLPSSAPYVCVVAENTQKMKPSAMLALSAPPPPAKTRDGDAD